VKSLYYTGSSIPVRYQKLELYYTMVPDTATGGPVRSPHIMDADCQITRGIPSSRPSAPMRSRCWAMRVARSPSTASSDWKSAIESSCYGKRTGVVHGGGRARR